MNNEQLLSELINLRDKADDLYYADSIDNLVQDLSHDVELDREERQRAEDPYIKQHKLNRNQLGIK